MNENNPPMVLPNGYVYGENVSSLTLKLVFNLVQGVFFKKDQDLEDFDGLLFCRLQNSPYFCLLKYARAVKQTVWNEAETESETETLFLSPHKPARALRARKTITPRFTDFFTDFEKETDCFAV